MNAHQRRRRMNVAHHQRDCGLQPLVRAELSLESHNAELAPSSWEVGGGDMTHRKRTHTNIIAMPLSARGLREVIMNVLLGGNRNPEARGWQEVPVLKRRKNLGIHSGAETGNHNLLNNGAPCVGCDLDDLIALPHAFREI